MKGEGRERKERECTGLLPEGRSIAIPLRCRLPDRRNQQNSSAFYTLKKKEIRNDRIIMNEKCNCIILRTYRIDTSPVCGCPQRCCLH